MKTIGVREFLKGGYKSSEPVLVMNRSKPLGVWDPTAVMPKFVSTWTWGTDYDAFTSSWTANSTFTSNTTETK